MIRVLFLLSVSLIFGQCSSSKNKSTEKQNNLAVKEQTISVNENEEEITEGEHPCYPGRKQLKQIKNQEATIVTITNRKMIFFEYTRLDPCALPEKFAKDDLKVVVSGTTYETPPNVRVAGQPFVISSIELLK